MERRQSSYGPSWRDLESYVRGMEDKYYVRIVISLVLDPAGRLGDRWRVRLAVHEDNAGVPGELIHADWRAYPSKQYKAITEPLHGMLVAAYAFLDRGGGGRASVVTGQARLV
jgi:hypothetical protein